MTLLQLEYITAVARYGSFVAAAKACGITQPTLTKQVQDLETELELQIFDRSVLPIAITQEGKAIIDQAKAVTKLADGVYRLAKITKQPSARRKRAAM